MKIFLQLTDSLLFFKNIGDWTEKLEEALNFPTSTAAADTCRNYGILNARIALIFDDAKPTIYFSCYEETVVSARNALSHLDGGEAATSI